MKSMVASTIEFEDSMKSIQAITASSNSEMATIGEAIKETARDTAFSISEIAGAVKLVAQAGVKIQEIPKVVKVIADVATASGSTIETVSDIITTAKEIWGDLDVETIGDRGCVQNLVNCVLNQLRSQFLITIG